MVAVVGYDIRVYADPTTGERMLCMMFYEYMRYRRRGVTHFAEAITTLEKISDDSPVYESDQAIDLVRWAINYSYGAAL